MAVCLLKKKRHGHRRWISRIIKLHELQWAGSVLQRAREHRRVKGPDSATHHRYSLINVANQNRPRGRGNAISYDSGNARPDRL